MTDPVARFYEVRDFADESYQAETAWGPDEWVELLSELITLADAALGVLRDMPGTQAECRAIEKRRKKTKRAIRDLKAER